MIKITPADKALADCIKLSVDYYCQRCGKRLGEKHRGLHASHFIGRGNWSVRFEPDNVYVHCYGCHAYLGPRPHEFMQWVVEQIGESRYDILMEKSRCTDRGRRARREVRDIAKHYRKQLPAFRARRDKGEMGQFMVVAYD